MLFGKITRKNANVLGYFVAIVNSFFIYGS